MTNSSKLALLFLTVVLSNCVSNPELRNSPGDNQGEVDLETIQNLLPGTYSNFAQQYDKGSDNPVTDTRIRLLNTGGEPVFLFESELRGQDASNNDLYWLKLNQQTRQAEFYFARIREDERSLPLQDILSIAWQRVVPGCVIPMSTFEGQLSGQTNPDTCRFESPLQGETRLIRGLSVGDNKLTITTELEGVEELQSSDEALLELQKHRAFEAWASVRIGTGQPQERPAEWQLSQVFNIRDDGRVNRLYDQKMVSMGFGLQLARLHRFDGEPPYFLLSVINMESGQTQAYQWFKPATGRLSLNLDWFQTNLELKNLANPQP